LERFQVHHDDVVFGDALLQKMLSEECE